MCWWNSVGDGDKCQGEVTVLWMFSVFKSEIRENTVHVQSLCSIDREHLHYLFRVRVVLSGRWVRLWETAGFLDDILSLPEPSALLERLSFLSSRMGRYICLRILSHCWHDALCGARVCVSVMTILSPTLSRWGHLCDVWGQYGLVLSVRTGFYDSWLNV